MTDPLREVAGLVLRESGVVIRDSQLPALEAAIRRVGPGMTAERLLERAAVPAAGEELVEQLIDQVTVKETFFMRHREELEAIDFRALAAHAQAAGRTSVRVWSAACASGEEAYSLGILALEAFAPGQPPVDILATDIAHSALARASAGRYGWRSVRQIDDARRARWFGETGSGLEVGPEPRRLVRFAHHNLLHDRVPPPGEPPFDLVVCRNVLIYFEPEAVRQTIARLQAALVPDGVLVLGAADRLTGGHFFAHRRSAPAPEPRERHHERHRRRERDRRVRTERETPVAASAAQTPLDADVELERGMTALAAGDADGAVPHLRRALYLDPECAIAAFQLARAHDARDDRLAARRSYWQALALLEREDDEVAGVLRTDLESVARARLAALGEG